MAKNNFYAIWLSVLIIGVFVLQVSLPGITENLVLNSRAINNFEIYRFVTAIFLHASLSHLVFNLFALILFGLILESIIKSKRFLLVFFLSGIIANIVSVNFYSSSLGASGAIMGIIGALAIIRPFMMVWAFGIIMPMSIAAILWILGDILGLFMPSNIGNIAHLSGVVVGILFGLIFRLSKKYKTNKKTKTRLNIPEDYMNQWENAYIKR